MSLAIGLNEHGREIQEAYRDVVGGGGGSLDWLLLTYSSPTTSELMLQSTGTGLEELEEEFNEGRIQFALARVLEPMTRTAKLVYIAWCGEGVPTSRKGKYASHAGQVGDFFRGYHLQINARTATDVEPKTILRKLENSGGSKYSTGATVGGSNPAPPPSQLHHQPGPEVQAKSAGYMPQLGKKPAPASKVFSSGYTNQPNFGQIPAPAPRTAPSQPSSATPVYGQGAPTPSTFSSANDEWDSSTSSAPKTAVPANSRPLFGGAVGLGGPGSTTQEPKQSAPPTTSTRPDVPEPVRGAYEPVQLAKPKPLGNRFPFAQSQSSSKPLFPSSVGSTSASQGVGRSWEQRQAEAKRESSTSSTLDHAVVAAASTTPEAPRGLEDHSYSPQVSDNSSQTPSIFTPKIGRGGLGGPAQPPTPKASTFEPRPDRGGLGGPAQPPAQAQSTQDPIFRPHTDRGGLGGPAMPPPPPTAASAAAGQEEDDDWDAGGDEQPRPTALQNFGGIPPPPAGGVAQAGELGNEQGSLAEAEREREYHEDVIRETQAEQVEDEEAARKDTRDLQIAEQQQQDAGSAPQTDAVKLSARATYGYDAAEENEVSFAEDDIILDIEMVDEGWWIGTNSRGERGLFPSNYCELIHEQVAAPSTAELHEHLQDPDVVRFGTPEAVPASNEHLSSGTSATALYDYEATEENELSFQSNDTITNIEMVSEDWWAGELRGQKGVFPANYVQVHE